MRSNVGRGAALVRLVWRGSLYKVVIVAAALAACSGGDSAPASTPEPGPSGTGTLVLSAAGGRFEDDSTGVVIVVPEGALASDVTVTITVAADASSAAAIPDWEIDGTGPAVTLGPDGTTFAKPIVLGVPMPLDAPAGWPTAAYALEAGKWARASLHDGSPTLSLYAPASKRAFFATDHFSTFTLGRKFDIFFAVPLAPDYLKLPTVDYQESWAGLKGVLDFLLDASGASCAPASGTSTACTSTVVGTYTVTAASGGVSGTATLNVTAGALKCTNEHLTVGAIAQRIDLGLVRDRFLAFEALTKGSALYAKDAAYRAAVADVRAALVVESDEPSADEQQLEAFILQWLASNAAAVCDAAATEAAVDEIAGALPTPCGALPAEADASLRLLCQGEGACGVAFGQDACDDCMAESCCEQTAACALDAGCKAKCLAGQAPPGPECGEVAKCRQASCAEACGACGGGTTKCGNKCVDTQTDPANCGACGVACAPGNICSAGQCVKGVPGPSCVGLPATCGPNGNASCCESKLVPGGTYYRSYDGVSYNDKSYPATVSDFRLDTYEVTVGRFRAFVNAGQGTQQNPSVQDAGKHPKIPGSGWDSAWNGSLAADTAALKTALKCSPSYQTWTDNAGANEKLPINCVTWYEAFAFCAWDGGRFATEAEWNYAAAGGSEQRVYPWSKPASDKTIDGSYAVYDCQGDGQGGCSFADILPVGSKPKGNGKWGQADIDGSMWEWTLDWYGSYPLPRNDCANLIATFDRVYRGGSWNFGASYLPSAFRTSGYFYPSDRYDGIGSRCARTP
ncbi:MAG: SUMF1/EgtB/PvdO family nonheme iron enzyme [Deltaproteobacteria bacterium]|nr:SUMF1/EgtB/PvdO family nonheme iron enzyme [Deltaproteobacteria bacterium]